MNSKECNFSFETNFERTTGKFQKNVIRTNDLARDNQIKYHEIYIFLLLAVCYLLTFGRQDKHPITMSSINVT
jgi:hypothetical protein